MPTVEVHSRIVGSSHQDKQLSSVGIELLHESLTVRELITHTIEEQIHDLLVHRKLEADQAQRILQQQYLTEANILTQSKCGTVKLPAHKPKPLPKLDIPEEIDKALTAFQQKTYLIIVDGEQVHDLDEELTLKPQSKVTFLRLTPLVGG